MRIKTYNLCNSLKSFSYTNIVVNGNFDNSTTGWSALASTITTSNNVLSVIGNGTDAFPYTQQNISVVNGRKYFLKCKLRVTNSNSTLIFLRYYESPSVNTTSSISTPSLNEWYEASLVVTATMTGTANIFIQHRYASSATANGKVMEVKEVFCIDLTSLGYTNLTLSDCNNIFKFVDGTKRPSFSKTLAV